MNEAERLARIAQPRHSWNVEAGKLSNGVPVAAVVRFVLDYECRTPVAAVAEWFHASPKEIYAVLDHYAKHKPRIDAQTRRLEGGR